ncbi:hypothetical protein [Bifidobacterium choloepi]|uniref:Sel1 repeat family protein n=1 Tax=Bifidobacterium choloepi TaxID=2614131 RepID=A0A6I5MXZ6_9BIFI|nr:hypothetical protein [Bifidobacterium choloepi]NEG69468.1 hypothetical protein [Bifidobacterium choloepi]
MKGIPWHSLPLLYDLDIKTMTRAVKSLEQDLAQGDPDPDRVEREEERFVNLYIPIFQAIQEELQLLDLAVAAESASTEAFAAQLSDGDRARIDNGIRHFLETTMFRPRNSTSPDREGIDNAQTVSQRESSPQNGKEAGFAYDTDLHTPAARALATGDYRTMAIYAALADEPMWDAARQRYRELHREERERKKREAERRKAERRIRKREEIAAKAKATPLPESSPCFDVAGAVHDMRWLMGHAEEEPIAYPNGLRHDVGDLDRFNPGKDPDKPDESLPRLVNPHDNIPVRELAGGWYFRHDDPIIGPLLPSIYITIPVWQDGRVVGRDRLWCYPMVKVRHTGVVTTWEHAGDAPYGIACYHDVRSDDYCTDEVDVSDPEGDEALGWAVDYYADGVRFTAPEDRQDRIDSFRAAEILFRHAAGRGSALAWLCLGYLYEYDRAEGQYYRSAFDWSPESETEQGRRFYSAPKKPELPVRAAACFRRAASAGIAEACFAYAELLRKHSDLSDNPWVVGEIRAAAEEDAEVPMLFTSGLLTGPDGDPDAGVTAADWYRRAHDMAMLQHNTRIAGSAALRLGDMAANGEGDEHGQPDYREALGYYETAVTSLEQTVRSGLDLFDQLLGEAQDGVTTMTQLLGNAQDGDAS